MKKKKMNLEALKVKSFVTTMEDGTENTAKGGTLIFTANPGCIIIIRTRANCPSWVDGCGSALGCTVLTTTRTTIQTTTTIKTTTVGTSINTIGGGL